MAMDHAVNCDFGGGRPRLSSLLCRNYGRRFGSAALERLYGRFATKCRRPALVQALFVATVYCWVTTLLRYYYGSMFAWSTLTVATFGVIWLTLALLLLNLADRLPALTPLVAATLLVFLTLFALIAMPFDHRCLLDEIGLFAADDDSAITTASPILVEAPYAAVQGVLEVFLVVYMILTFLPLNHWLCWLVSVALVLIQLVTAWYFANIYRSHIWEQLCANLLAVVCCVVAASAVRLWSENCQRDLFLNMRNCFSARTDVQQQNAKLDQLLASVFPDHIASAVRQDLVQDYSDEGLNLTSTPEGKNYIRHPYFQQHHEISFLFADLSGFDGLETECSPQDSGRLLDQLFTRFDQLAEEQNCSRVKLLGDGYMAACGLVNRRADHADCCVRLGLQIVNLINNTMAAGLQLSEQYPFRLFSSLGDQLRFGVRVGVHSGSAESGVIGGGRRWCFDVVGADAALARRIERSGNLGRVHLSSTTAELLQTPEIALEAGYGQSKDAEIARAGLTTYFVRSTSPQKINVASTLTTLGHLVNSPGQRSSLYGIPPAILFDTVANSPTTNNSAGSSGGDCKSPVVSASNPLSTSPSQQPNGTILSYGIAGGIPSVVVEAPLHKKSKLRFRKRQRTKTDHQLLEGDESSELLENLIRTNSLSTMASISGVLNQLTLTFKDWLLESRYRKSRDRSLMFAALISLVCLSLHGAMHYLVLKRYLPSIVLFGLALVQILFVCIVLTSRTCHNFRAYISITFLGQMLISLLIISLTVLWAIVNCFSCHNLETIPASDVWADCAVPDYTVLSGLVSLLALSLFVKISALIRFLVSLLLCAIYAIIFFYAHSVLHIRHQKLTEQEFPPNLQNLALLVTFAVLAFVEARYVELRMRLNFLWRMQTATEISELSELQRYNRRLLVDLLPTYIAHKSVSTLPWEAMDRCIRHSATAGVLYVNVLQCDGDATELSLGRLNEVICDLDALLANQCFSSLEKVKSFGNGYVVVSGVTLESDETTDHLSRLADFALAVVENTADGQLWRNYGLKVRLGLSVGGTTVGLLGGRKAQFDAWGKAVNRAFLLERTGETMRIHVTDEVYLSLRYRAEFRFEQRPERTKLKDNLQVTTYFLCRGDRMPATVITGGNLLSNEKSPLQREPVVASIAVSDIAAARRKLRSAIVKGSEAISPSSPEKRGPTDPLPSDMVVGRIMIGDQTVEVHRSAFTPVRQSIPKNESNQSLLTEHEDIGRMQLMLNRAVDDVIVTGGSDRNTMHQPLHLVNPHAAIMSDDPDTVDPLSDARWVDPRQRLFVKESSAPPGYSRPSFLGPLYNDIGKNIGRREDEDIENQYDDADESSDESQEDDVDRFAALLVEGDDAYPMIGSPQSSTAAVLITPILEENLGSPKTSGYRIDRALAYSDASEGSALPPRSTTSSAPNAVVALRNQFANAVKPRRNRHRRPHPRRTTTAAEEMMKRSSTTSQSSVEEERLSRAAVLTGTNGQPPVSSAASQRRSPRKPLVAVAGASTNAKSFLLPTGVCELSADEASMTSSSEGTDGVASKMRQLVNEGGTFPESPPDGPLATIPTSRFNGFTSPNASSVHRHNQNTQPSSEDFVGVMSARGFAPFSGLPDGRLPSSSSDATPMQHIPPLATTTNGCISPRSETEDRLIGSISFEQALLRLCAPHDDMPESDQARYFTSPSATNGNDGSSRQDSVENGQSASASTSNPKPFPTDLQTPYFLDGYANEDHENVVVNQKAEARKSKLFSETEYENAEMDTDYNPFSETESQLRGCSPETRLLKASRVLIPGFNLSLERGGISDGMPRDDSVIGMSPFVGRRRSLPFASLDYLGVDAGHEADIDSVCSSRASSRIFFDESARFPFPRQRQQHRATTAADYDSEYDNNYDYRGPPSELSDMEIDFFPDEERQTSADKASARRRLPAVDGQTSMAALEHESRRTAEDLKLLARDIKRSFGDFQLASFNDRIEVSSED